MTAPAAPQPLLTAQQVEDITGAAPDDTLMRKVAAAAAAIRRAAGWHIGPVVVETLTLDGDGGRVLPIPTGRLVELVAVTVGDDSVDVTPYVKASAGGWIKRSHGRFPDDPSSVVVTIRHGYDIGTLPDLAELVVDVARRATDPVPAGIQQETNGSRSTTYREPDLFAYERAQLAPFTLGRLS